jgi:hypothetical protein
MTDFNKDNLEYFKNNMPNVHYFNDPMILFGQLNFTQVMHGLRLFNNERILSFYNTHLCQYTTESNTILKSVEDELQRKDIFSHRQALNILKERYAKTEYKF